MSNLAAAGKSLGTSVDGGDIDSQNDRTVDELNISDVQSKEKSFASALKTNSAINFTFPDRDQAIVFDTIENTVKNDYIISVGEIVEPKNVIFASRVSNNRVCIYLSSKEAVESFITTQGGVTIGNSFVPARRLVSPAKRVILSNVSPCLPHDVVERELKQASLKIVSAINFIGAGISQEKYRHVLSFRRQVYIVLDKEDKLPDSLLIQFKGNVFRIFLTTDEIRCFSCKNIGHVASKCPTSNADMREGRNFDTASNEIIETNLTTENRVHAVNIEHTKDNSKSKKRQAPPSTPTGSEVGSTLEEPASCSSGDKHKKKNTEVDFVKPKSKKKKEENILDDSSLYSEFQGLFNEKIEVMSFNNLCKFLDEVKGKQDALLVAKTFTEDIDSLLELLIKAVRVVKTNTIKARIKRLIKKIKTDLGTRDESDLSWSQGYSTEASEY